MTPLTVIVALVGVPVMLSALYLLVLAVASGFYRPSPARKVPHHRLLVLVPAHNEAEMISRCVGSLLSQGYPRELFRVVVIADNCTDATAALAERAGAEVMRRDEPGARGKGQALRWAIDRILAESAAPDALVMVDADSIAESHLLAELEARLASGHEVVQADDLVLPERGSLRSVLEATALLLRNRVRFAGRGVLGLPATLCGNGMLLSRRVLEAHPWNAFTVAEDGEYAIGLRLAGVRTAFAQNARVLAAATRGGRGALTQGLRWESGRFQNMRRWCLPVMRAILFERRIDLLDLLLDLAVLPLGLLSGAAITGTVISVVLLATHMVAPWAVVPWILALVFLPVYVVAGLRGAHAPGAFYRALLLAPLFMVRKLGIYSRLLSGHGPGGWVRTDRPSDSSDSDARASNA